MTATPPTEPTPGGLRERKKARTRALVRQQALRLFREQGYAATTVEQIAEAAEISPSTFFRYFPTKEDVIFSGDVDPEIISRFMAAPADRTPVQAFRSAVHAVLLNLSDEDLAAAVERHRLTFEVPELRAAALQNMAASVEMLSNMIADRAGRDPADFEVRVFAGAVFGTVMSVNLARPLTSGEELIDAIDRALALLEAGLPL